MNKTKGNRTQQIKLELSLLQLVGHYSFAIVPLIIPGMEFYYSIIQNERINQFPILLILICIAFSGFIIFWKHKELKTNRIHGQYSDNEFKQSVYATANQQNWIIEEFSKTKMKASANGRWSNSWFNILIERKTNYIDITSTMTPWLSLPDLMGTNESNVFKFSENLYKSKIQPNLNEEIIEELKKKEDKWKTESEWTLKNILKRSIAYLFSFGFLAIAATAFVHEGISLIAIIFALLGSFYIILDIYVIWNKRKNTSS